MRIHSSIIFKYKHIFRYRDFKLFDIKFYKNILSCFIKTTKTNLRDLDTILNI